MPDPLTVTAETDDRLVMGLEHKTLAVHGVQFHPESIASEHGHLILKNFLELAAQWNAQRQLVSRTRSSHDCSAGTFANFGTKGTLES
jgi:anthranilate synthase component 2